MENNTVSESGCAAVDLGEFTAPFDLERFKAGEKAVYIKDGMPRNFGCIKGTSLFSRADHEIHARRQCRLSRASALYRMRPAVKDIAAMAEQDAKEAQRIAKERALAGVAVPDPTGELCDILQAHTSRDWKTIETVVVLETEKQRLTREASTRYFSKLDQQSERTSPVGENKMLEIFGQALDDFEAEVERRRNENHKN